VSGWYRYRVKEACVQLPTSAVDVALPVFADEQMRFPAAAGRPAAAAFCRYYRRARRSAANLSQRAGKRWDRQTDRQTPQTLLCMLCEQCQGSQVPNCTEGNGTAVHGADLQNNLTTVLRFRGVTQPSGAPRHFLRPGSLKLITKNSRTVGAPYHQWGPRH